ncbi:MAG: 2-amino-4-hydroxy-6-hydroxymethyldihydropteridine diphosphokinase [Myxococcales bacterium]|nr:2-amino-4-hydroxy-6-hydroxymethyldihydropteridine diphosphokinase [Myxococcales bacterium]
MTIVIGLGGNVGTEAEILERFRLAREALAALGTVRSAPLYRTAPLGPAQAAFYNTAVALVAPDVQPTELHAILLELERLLGRRREQEVRWGPRTLDLDVLVWGERVIRTPELEIPHPRLTERRFALAPLAELLGEDAVVLGKPLSHWLATVHEQAVEHLASTW